MSRRGKPLGREPAYPTAEKIRLHAAIGNAIRTLREGEGMSRRELAEAIGVSTSTLDNYEDGITPPTLIALYRTAMALDCTLDDLMPVLSDEAAA